MQRAKIGIAYDFTFPADTFNDQDAGSVITYTAAVPSWLTFTRGNDGTGRRFHAAANTVPSTAGTHMVTITATSGTDTIEHVFQIAVAQNVDPSITENGSQSYTINENATAGSLTDTGYSFTFADSDGTVANKNLSHSGFSLSTDDKLQIKANTTFNYEALTNGQVEITVTVTDNDGASTTHVVTLTVVDQNDAPTVANAISDVNAVTSQDFTFTVPANTFNDQDNDTLTYSTEKPSWLSFNANTRVYSASTTSFPATGTYPVTVSVTDDGTGSLTASDSFNIILSDNPVPVFDVTGEQHVVINENAVLTEDVETRFTVEITDDGNVAAVSYSDALFELSVTTGNKSVLIMDASKVFNYEVNNNYTVTITATDNQNGKSTQTIVLDVTDVNEAPVFVLGGASIAVNELSIGLPVSVNRDTGHDVSFVDPDTTPNTFNVSILNNDATLTLFDINNGNLRIISKTGNFLDFETNGTILVTLQATETNGSPINLVGTGTLTVYLTDVNEAPELRTPIVLPTMYKGQYFSTIFPANSYVDPEGREVTYSQQSVNFFISAPGSGRRFQGTPPETTNRPAPGEYTHIIRASDGAGQRTTITVAFTVRNNPAPVIELDGDAIMITENVNQAVGTNTKIEVNITDIGTVNATVLSDTRFAITTSSVATLNNRIVIASTLAFDYEVNNHYTVTITATDTQNASSTQNVTFTIVGVNETPSITKSGSAAAIDEIATGTVQAVIDTGFDVSFSDPENNTYSITILNNTSSGTLFAIDNNNNLNFASNAGSLNFEVKSHYTVSVRAIETGSHTPKLSSTETFTVDIDNVNEVPLIEKGYTQTRIGEQTLAATLGTGYTVSIGDTDGGTLPVTTISDTTNFELNNLSLIFKSGVVLDHEGSNETYTITITVTDSDGLTATETVTVSVADDPEDPTVANPNPDIYVKISHPFSHQFPLNTFNDQDEGNVFTYISNSPANRPAWLNFTPATRTFNANANAQGRPTAATVVSVTVIARDSTARTVSDVFELSVKVNAVPGITRSGSQTYDIDENTTRNAVTDTGYRLAFADTDGTVTQIDLSHAGFSLGTADTNNITLATLQIKAATMFDYEVLNDGDVVITITATDNNSETGTHTLTIEVDNVNEPPVITKSGSAMQIAEANFTVDTDTGLSLTAADPEGVNVLFRVLPNNSGFKIQNRGHGKLQIESGTTFDYETTAQQKHTITIRAQDTNGNYNDEVVTISITNVNEPPIIGISGMHATNLVELTNDLTLTEDIDTGYDVVITDPEGASTNYNIVDNTTNLTLYNIDNNNNFNFDDKRGKLDYEIASAFTATIVAWDSTTPTPLTATAFVTVTIANVNEAPTVVTDIPDQNAEIGQSFRYDLPTPLTNYFIDPDAGTRLQYSAHTPTWLSFNTAVRRFNASANQVPSTAGEVGVTVSISDGSLTVTAQFKINIIANQLPDITTIGMQTLTIFDDDRTRSGNINTGYSITINDPDGTLNAPQVRPSNNGFRLQSSLLVPSSTVTVYHLQIRSGNQANFEDSEHVIATIIATDNDNGSTTTRITLTVTDVNEAPTIVESGSLADIDEGTYATDTDTGFIFSANDPDASSSFTWVISDTVNFKLQSTLTGGKLQIKSGTTFDYEQGRTHNNHLILITVTDNGTPGLTDTHQVRVRIRNTNDTPSISMTGTQNIINEGSIASDTNTGIRLSASDQDQNQTYAWVVSDTTRFQLSSPSGRGPRDLQIKSGTSFDYDTTADRSITITITVTDSGTPARSATQVVTIGITDVNHTPDLTKGGSHGTINEGIYQTDTDTGYTFTATDEDADASLQFAVSDTNFKLENARTGGKLQIKNGTTFDYDVVANRFHTITITVSDGTNTDTEVVIITITDVNVSPVLTRGGSQNVISEGTYTNVTDTGYTFSATDLDDSDTLTWSMTGSALFSLESTATGGKLQIVANTTFDYDVTAQRTHTLTITVTDSVNTPVTNVVTISISDVNHAPVLTRTGTTQEVIREGRYGSDTDTGFSFSATDVDTGTTFTYSVSDAVNFKLESTSTGGKLQIVSGRTFDYDVTAHRVHTITVTVSDGTSTDTEVVTISITDVNHTPVLSKTGNQSSINEGTFATDTDTGLSFSATDEDNGTTFTYLVSDSNFKLESSSTGGKLQIRSGVSFDYDVTAERNHTITITVSDGNTTATEVVTISISNFNYNPVLTRGGSHATLNEGRYQSATNTGFTFTATDADADDSLTFSISDTNNFQIQDTSTGGNLQIRANRSFDYDITSQRSFVVIVTVTDGTNTVRNTVTISITNINQQPTVANPIEDQNAVAGDPWTFQFPANTFVDADDGTTFSYSMSGPGWVSLNSATRTFSGTVTANLGVITITVTATDEGGLSVSDVFEVTVSNNAVPVIATVGSQQIAITENSAVTADTQTGFSFTFSDSDGTVNNSTKAVSHARFRLDASDRLIMIGDSAVIDFEATPAFTVTISVADDQGSIGRTVVTITVVNQNEPPVISSTGSAGNLLEGPESRARNTGFVIRATDPDANTSFDFSVSDNNFQIESPSSGGNLQLKANVNLNFENTNHKSHTITITVSDGSLTDTVVVTVTINDRNEAPTVANAIANQLAVIGQSFSYTIPADTFIDQDDGDTAALTYAATLPSWLTFNPATRVLSASANVVGPERSENVTITATDADGLSVSDVFEVSVVTNPPPVIQVNGSQTQNITENTPLNSDTDTGFSFSFTDNTSVNNASKRVSHPGFALVGSSNTNVKLQIKSTTALDYEDGANQVITIYVSDDEGAEGSALVTIAVRNLDEAPVIASVGTQVSLLEGNFASDTNTGLTYSATDPEGAQVVLSATGSAKLKLTNGRIQIIGGSSFNYETSTDRTHVITVTATDQTSNSSTATITITISNRNEAPVLSKGGTGTNRNENATDTNPTDTGFTFSATDVDIQDSNDSISFSVSDTTNFLIESTGVNRKLQIQGNIVFDFETKSTYTVTVTVTDAAGLTDTEVVTVSVNNVNDKPTVENPIPDQFISINNPYSYQFPDNVFNDQDTGDVLTYEATLPDQNTASVTILFAANMRTFSADIPAGAFETTVSVTVKATDDGTGTLSTVDIFQVIVLSNALPVVSTVGSQTYNIMENATRAASTPVGYSFTYRDPDANGSILPGTQRVSHAGFELVNDRLYIKATTMFDFETNQTFTVTVFVKDNKQGEGYTAVTLTITNVNEAPEISSTGNQNVINENTNNNNPFDTNISFTATDVDIALSNDSISFSISDTTNFQIAGTGASRQLQVKPGISFDFETKATYTVTVTVSDAGALSDTEVVTISITDQNDVPTVANPIEDQFISIGEQYTYQIPENAFADQDANDTLAYTALRPAFLNFAAGTRTFSALVAAGTAESNHMVTVTVTDGDNAKTIDIFSVAVLSNALPQITVHGQQDITIRENAPFGSDTNTGFRFTYGDRDGTVVSTSVGHTGFRLINNQLFIKGTTEFNYEVNMSLTVTFFAKDNENGVGNKAVTLAIQNVNEPASISISGTPVSINEGVFNAQSNTGYQAHIIDPEGATLTIRPADSSFTWDRSNNNIIVSTGATLDFELTPTIFLTLNVADGNFNVSEVVSIVLGDVRDKPSAVPIPTQTVFGDASWTYNVSSAFVLDAANRSGISISANIPALLTSWLDFDISMTIFRLHTLPARDTIVTITLTGTDLDITDSNTNSTENTFTLVVFLRDAEVEARMSHAAIAPRVIQVIGDNTYNAISNRAYESVTQESLGMNLLEMIANKREQINNGEITWMEFFHDQEWSLPIGLGSSTSIWGNANRSNLEGKTVDDSYKFEGDVFSANLGFEVAAGNNSQFGIAAGTHTGEFDYTHKPLTTDNKGKYEFKLNTVNPYVILKGERTIFGAIGLGEGSIDVTGTGIGDFVTKADTQYVSGVLGFAMPARIDVFKNVFGLDEDVSSNLKVKGNIVYSDFSVDDVMDETIPDFEYTGTRVRVGVDYQRQLSDELVSNIEFALRGNWSDTGSGEDTTLVGYETNARFDYARAESRYLSLGGNIRYINIPKTSFTELGYGANLRYAPVVGNLGLRFDLNPSYATNGEHTIWNMENENDLNSLMSEEFKLNVKSRLSYGIGAPRLIIVPFTAYSLADDDYDYSLGIDLLKVQRSKLGFSFTGFSEADKTDEYKIYYTIFD